MIHFQNLNAALLHQVNLEEIHGYTALCEAVWQNNTDMAELLVSRGARVTTQSHMLLHCAVSQGNTAMARLLLNARSVPNLRDDHGNTPLILAARQVCLTFLPFKNKGESVDYRVELGD